MKKIFRSLVWLILSLLIVLNILAYHHAGSFFYYSESGIRTPPPEELSWGQKFKILINGIDVPKPKAHSSPGSIGLIYENIMVPGRDDLMLSGWFIPASQATILVVMFHGYNSEKSGLLSEARMFHDVGYDVLMVDFPGSGESLGNMTSLGILEANDVASVYLWARGKWPEQRIVLYGHSMGAASIMRAVALNGVKPDVAVIESVFDTLLNAVRFRFDLLSAPSFPAAEILLFWGSVKLKVNGFGHDVVKYAASVDVPVIMIHGEQDNRASWQGAHRVFEALNGRKQFLLIPDAGHVNPGQGNPEMWKNTVKAFIENPDGSRQISSSLK